MLQVKTSKEMADDYSLNYDKYHTMINNIKMKAVKTSA